MAHSDGTDLTSAEVQLEMFGAPSTPTDLDSADVRAEIADMLGKVRAARGEPWDASDLVHLRNIFTRMAEHLPSDEAAQLRGELETELARLTAV